MDCREENGILSIGPSGAEVCVLKSMWSCQSVSVHQIGESLESSHEGYLFLRLICRPGLPSRDHSGLT